MGLSSKQVSSSGLDWNNNLLESQKLELLPKPHHQMKKQQQQSEQQSSETLKCPRCDSSNTKFCYYNNYNKSQPRHFCRACKRHWTKGGTLRNVPVGGGRKNKRNKKPITPTTTTTATTTSTITNKTSTCTTSFTNTTMNNNLQTTTPLAVLSDHKNIASSSLYQALIRPPPSLLLQQQHQNNNNNSNNNNLMNMRDLVESGKDFGSSMSLSSSHQNQSLLFPFSISSSCFYTNPCSVSTTSLRTSSNVYNYVEESTINSVIPPSTTNSAAGTNTQLWEMLPAATSAGTTAMGMSNYWSWEDIDSLVSTDLKDPWDDSDIKP